MVDPDLHPLLTQRTRRPCRARYAARTDQNSHIREAATNGLTKGNGVMMSTNEWRQTTALYQTVLCHNSKFSTRCPPLSPHLPQNSAGSWPPIVAPSASHTPECEEHLIINQSIDQSEKAASKLISLVPRKGHPKLGLQHWSAASHLLLLANVGVPSQKLECPFTVAAEIRGANLLW